MSAGSCASSITSPSSPLVSSPPALVAKNDILLLSVILIVSLWYVVSPATVKLPVIVIVSSACVPIVIFPPKSAFRADTTSAVVVVFVWWVSIILWISAGVNLLIVDTVPSVLSCVVTAETWVLYAASTSASDNWVFVVVSVGTPHVPSPFKNFTLSDAVGALTKPAVPALVPSAPV